MTTKYLLPCPACGKKLEVDASQSGLATECACGTRVAIPTYRDLKELERVGAAADEEPADASLKVHRAFVVIGVLLMLVGGGSAGALWFNPPKPPPPSNFGYDVPTEFADAPLIETMEYWHRFVSEGLTTNVDLAAEQKYQKWMHDHKQWLGIAVATICIGVVLIGIGLVVQSPAPKPTPAKALSA